MTNLAVTARLVGISFREAARRACRGTYRWAMSIHGSVELATGPDDAALICAQCRPVVAWPCEHYEKAERGLAALEAEWARQDSERVAS